MVNYVIRCKNKVVENDDIARTLEIQEHLKKEKPQVPLKASVLL